MPLPIDASYGGKESDRSWRFDGVVSGGYLCFHIDYWNASCNRSARRRGACDRSSIGILSNRNILYVLNNFIPMLRRLLIPMLGTIAAAESTFVLVWFLRHPPEALNEALSLIPFSLLMVIAAAVPVVLGLVLSRMILIRINPRLGEGSVPGVVLFMLFGVGWGVGVVFLLLGQLDFEGEFFRVVLLSAAIGGAVGGATLRTR